MATQHAYNNEYEHHAQTQLKAKKKKSSSRAKTQRQVLLWTFMLTAAALFLLWRYAALDESQRELQRVTAELHAIESTNQHLQRQIDRSIDLTELERRAIEDFGMRRIEHHQRLFIDMNTAENVGEINSQNLDTVPIESGILYGVPGVLIRTIQTLR